MNCLSGLLIFFVTSFAIIRGIPMLVSGKMKRTFAKGYKMVYEGTLVRILGVVLILLGICLALIISGMFSETGAIIFLSLIFLSGGIIGMFVEQNGILIKE